jgi:hypothetical protein
MDDNPRRRLTPMTPWPAAGSLDAHIRAEEVRVAFQQAPPAKVTARAADTPGRWGGEEFALLLPETGGAAAALYLAKAQGRNRVATGARRQPQSST